MEVTRHLSATVSSKRYTSRARVVRRQQLYKHRSAFRCIPSFGAVQFLYTWIGTDMNHRMHCFHMDSLLPTGNSNQAKTNGGKLSGINVAGHHGKGDCTDSSVTEAALTVTQENVTTLPKEIEGGMQAAQADIDEGITLTSDAQLQGCGAQEPAVPHLSYFIGSSAAARESTRNALPAVDLLPPVRSQLEQSGLPLSYFIAAAAAERQDGSKPAVPVDSPEKVNQEITTSAVMNESMTAPDVLHQQLVMNEAAVAEGCEQPAEYLNTALDVQKSTAVPTQSVMHVNTSTGIQQGPLQQEAPSCTQETVQAVGIMMPSIKTQIQEDSRWALNAGQNTEFQEKLATLNPHTQLHAANPATSTPGPVAAATSEKLDSVQAFDGSDAIADDVMPTLSVDGAAIVEVAAPGREPPMQCCTGAQQMQPDTTSTTGTELHAAGQPGHASSVQEIRAQSVEEVSEVSPAINVSPSNLPPPGNAPGKMPAEVQPKLLRQKIRRGFRTASQQDEHALPSLVVNITCEEDFIKEVEEEVAKPVVLYVSSKVIIQSGEVQEAEVHWKNDPQVRRMKQTAAQLLTVLEQCAREAPNVKFVHMQADKPYARALCRELELPMLPCLQFYRQGDMLCEFFGTNNIQRGLAEGLLYYTDTAARGNRVSPYVPDLHSGAEVDDFIQSRSDQDLTVVGFFMTALQTCVHVFPAMYALAKSHPNISLARVLGDESDDIWKYCVDLGLVQAPTFIFYRRGQELGRFVGSNKSDLIGQVLNYIIRPESPVLTETPLVQVAKPLVPSLISQSV